MLTEFCGECTNVRYFNANSGRTWHGTLDLGLGLRVCLSKQATLYIENERANVGHLPSSRFVSDAEVAPCACRSHLISKIDHVVGAENDGLGADLLGKRQGCPMASHVLGEQINL